MDPQTNGGEWTQYGRNAHQHSTWYKVGLSTRKMLTTKRLDNLLDGVTIWIDAIKAHKALSESIHRQHGIDQMLHIKTGLNSVFAARIYKKSTPQKSGKTGKITALSFTKDDTRTYNDKLSILRLIQPRLMNAFSQKFRRAIG